MDSIRLVLQGGGTKCAYQLSFLNKLINNDIFKKKYTIEKIYGTSFGALVGYFICIKRTDILEFFFNSLDENSLKPIFDLWGIKKYIKNIPIIGIFITLIINMFWLLKGLKEKGLFDQNHGTDILYNITLDKQQEENLKNYYCCVFNISKQKLEYINGSHPLIKDYIMASASLWIVFKPKLIQQLKTECVCNIFCNCRNTNDTNIFCNCSDNSHKYNEFMDGGILKPIPFEIDDAYSGKYLIMTTKDINTIINKQFLFNNSGNNLFEYLDKIITFMTEYHQHMDICYYNKNWHKLTNVIIVNYKSKYTDPTILKKEIIKEYIKDGELLADEFLTSLN